MGICCIIFGATAYLISILSNKFFCSIRTIPYQSSGWGDRSKAKFIENET
jgi:hypothetical protein